MSGFHYQPLDASKREIRLLNIIPGDSSDPIRCTIRHASLTASPAYKALSYVWGESPTGVDGKTLRLENVDVPATTNLLAALRQLRASVTGGGESACVWVDALCINQGDVVERSQQVSMMRDVYSSAEQVVIWLGEADDSSDESFDALQSVVDGASADEATSGRTEQRSGAMYACGDFFFNLVQSRQWFWRTWVLQELAMAKEDPLVLCGSKSATWSLLMRAWDAVAIHFFTETGLLPLEQEDDDDNKRVAEASKTYTRPMMKMDMLNQLRVVLKSKGGMSLRQLLLIARTSRATDPRDRIYGILGLVGYGEEEKVEEERPIVVDYVKPVSVVYADAMAHLFSRGEGAFILAGMFLPGLSCTPMIPEPFLGGSAVQQTCLPSWAPDFSRQTSSLASQPAGTIFHPPANRRGASGVGSDAHNGTVLKDNITLQIEGLLVGTISQVTTLGSSIQECIDMLPDLEVTARETWQRECTQEPPAITEFMNRWRKEEPLWRILISNKRWNSGYQVAPPQYEAQYQELLEKNTTKESSGIPHLQESSKYELNLAECPDKKALFTTDSGFVGTGVQDVAAGDIVAVIFGAPTPFVLRPLGLRDVVGEETQVHGLVGMSYVGGIMTGEMVDELYCEDLMDSTTLYIQ